MDKEEFEARERGVNELIEVMDGVIETALHNLVDGYQMAPGSSSHETMHALLANAMVWIGLKELISREGSGTTDGLARAASLEMADAISRGPSFADSLRWSSEPPGESSGESHDCASCRDRDICSSASKDSEDSDDSEPPLTADDIDRMCSDLEDEDPVSDPKS